MVKNMETGAKLRFGTPQESLEEFRIESGAPMPSESRATSFRLCYAPVQVAQPQKT